MKSACLLLLAALPAAAQEEGITLSAPKASVLIGMPIDVAVEARYSAGFSLKAPAPGQDTGTFEILSAEIEPGGTKARLRVAAFGLGRQTLPSLEWPLVGPDGRTRALVSSPLTLTIEPPRPALGDKGELRDIRDPVPVRLWPWAAAALAALLAAALLLRRRRAASGPGAAVPDARTPEEIALSDIDGLAGLGLPVKEFYDRLSDILRLYLERRCGLKALQMTTYDLHRRMIRAELEPKARALAKNLLDRCDLAKFARFLPSEEDSRKDCANAKGVVYLLAPKPAPAKETAGREAVK